MCIQVQFKQFLRFYTKEAKDSHKVVKCFKQIYTLHKTGNFQDPFIIYKNKKTFTNIMSYL